MDIQVKKEPLILFLGDIVFFYVSLFLMLFISYRGLPQDALLSEHLGAFSLLFVVWFLVFFIAGLYEKHTVIFKNRLPQTILNAQIVNIALSVTFFYLIPYFAIAPKANLFVYLIISFVLVLYWRIYFYPKVGPAKREKAVIIGSGNEMQELIAEVNNNSRYNLHFLHAFDLNVDSFDDKSIQEIRDAGVRSVVVDIEDPRLGNVLGELYGLIYEGLKFYDKHKVYEEIFDKIPISLLGYSWFLENISLVRSSGYDFFKRAIDVLIALFLGLFALILAPFVILAIKFESTGGAFIKQERIGKNNRRIKILKFRTMERDDKGEEVLHSQNKVTKVGKFLRKTRIDELPQLWNVLKGDISLIGPRPELPELAKIYTKAVPYYNVRHLIKPGLSGWGQINDYNVPKGDLDVDRTKTKLSYDLYYLKNRSVILDLKITLRTIKTLLSRSGV